MRAPGGTPRPAADLIADSTRPSRASWTRSAPGSMAAVWWPTARRWSSTSPNTMAMPRAAKARQPLVQPGHAGAQVRLDRPGLPRRQRLPAGVRRPRLCARMGHRADRARRARGHDLRRHQRDPGDRPAGAQDPARRRRGAAARCWPNSRTELGDDAQARASRPSSAAFAAFLREQSAAARHRQGRTRRPGPLAGRRLPARRWPCCSWPGPGPASAPRPAPTPHAGRARRPASGAGSGPSSACAWR